VKNREDYKHVGHEDKAERIDLTPYDLILIGLQMGTKAAAGLWTEGRHNNDMDTQNPL
jgi:hypothetical protein